MQRLSVVLVLLLVGYTYAGLVAFVPDSPNLRKVNLETGAVTTFALPISSDFVMEQVVVDESRQKLYVSATGSANLVFGFDTEDPETVEVVSGALSGAVATDQSDIENGLLTSPLGFGLTDSKDILVADVETSVIVKILSSSLDSGSAGSQEIVTGQYGVNSESDGTGTMATLNRPKRMCMSTDGTTAYIPSRAADKLFEYKVASKTLKAIAGSGVDGYAEGTGTNAELSNPKSCAVSPDGTKVYIGGDAAIWEYVVASGQVRLVAGGTTTSFPLVDGVGSNAVIVDLKGCSVSPDGSVYFVEDCGDGGVVRHLDPETKTVTSFAGDYSDNGCLGSGKSLGKTQIDGSASAALFGDQVGMPTVAVEICGQYFHALATNVDLAGSTGTCEEIVGGTTDIPVAVNFTEMTISLDTAFNNHFQLVESQMTVIDNAVVTFNTLEVISSSLILDGGSATAQSVSFDANTVYQLVIDSGSPRILAITGEAVLAGTVVLVADEDVYKWVEGVQITILTYNSKTGTFDSAGYLSLPGEESNARRSLLQESASAVVQIACGDDSCVANITNNDDDDDTTLHMWIGILIGATVLLVLALAIALGILKKKTSSETGKSGAPRSAAAPYGAAASSDSYYDSYSTDLL